MGTSLTVIDKELSARLPMFQQVLPPSVSPQRLMRTVMMSVERLPKLLDCTPQSIMNAATTAAVLGLECDGVTGQGFIIPYGNVATFQVGYKGYNTLAARAGYTINGEVVREGDEFDYQLGTGGYVKHKPLLVNTSKRRIVAAWATAESTGRPAIVTVMSIEEILQIKERSRGAKKPDSPWNDANGPGFAAMCSKTAKRRLARSMPLSVMQQAAALEDRLDVGEAAWLEPGGELKTVGGASMADEPIRDAQPVDITTPANPKPAEEWPTFETLGKWADWSIDTFLPGADKVKAKAWHDHFKAQFAKLASLQDDPKWSGYYDDLMRAYGAASVRG